MAILAAFALVHAEHHALGINVADLQRDHLHGSQTSAVGDAERRLVLGPGRGLQEAQHLFRRKHAGQPGWRSTAGKWLEICALSGKPWWTEPSRRWRWLWWSASPFFAKAARSRCSCMAWCPPTAGRQSASQLAG